MTKRGGGCTAEPRQGTADDMPSGNKDDAFYLVTFTKPHRVRGHTGPRLPHKAPTRPHELRCGGMGLSRIRSPTQGVSQKLSLGTFCCLLPTTLTEKVARALVALVREVFLSDTGAELLVVN